MSYFDDDPYEGLDVPDLPTPLGIVSEDTSDEVVNDVSYYAYSDVKGIEYPCLILDGSFEIPKHKITILQQMLSSSSEDADIRVYLQAPDGTYELGKVSSSQVNSLLSIINTDTNPVRGYLDSETELLGSKVYVLSY